MRCVTLLLLLTLSPLSAQDRKANPYDKPPPRIEIEAKDKPKSGWCMEPRAWRVGAVGRLAAFNVKRIIGTHAMRVECRGAGREGEFILCMPTKGLADDSFVNPEHEWPDVVAFKVVGTAKRWGTKHVVHPVYLKK